jgi:hypothetical protein
LADLLIFRHFFLAMLTTVVVDRSRSTDIDGAGAARHARWAAGNHLD